MHLMTKEDRFDKVDRSGNFLWISPLAAGDVAINQLCDHIYVRLDMIHTFMIPTLSTAHWR